MTAATAVARRGGLGEVGAGAPTTVVVLATGGTIAQSGSRTATLAVDDLVSAIPRRDALPPLRCEQVFQVSSPEITPDHWLVLARRVAKLLADPDVRGLVVTHGTDTLEETAFFLNLVIDSDKPVVVVGSMRPADKDGADGPRNLRNAILVAASPDAIGQGVLVTLNDRIEGARDTTKTHTSAVDAFRSPDAGPLGWILDDLVRFDRTSLRRHTRRSDFAGSAEGPMPRVDIVYGYAGMGPEQLDAVAAVGARGVIIACTGNGSVPHALERTLVGLRRSGVAVVRSSRTNGGHVTRNGEVDDDRLDLVSADSLNPQKARVLLMLALAVTGDMGRIQRIFDEH